jgi:hypothetical protein
MNRFAHGTLNTQYTYLPGSTCTLVVRSVIGPSMVGKVITGGTRRNG